MKKKEGENLKINRKQERKVSGIFYEKDSAGVEMVQKKSKTEVWRVHQKGTVMGGCSSRLRDTFTMLHTAAGLHSALFHP